MAYEQRDFGGQGGGSGGGGFEPGFGRGRGKRMPSSRGDIFFKYIAVFL